MNGSDGWDGLMSFSHIYNIHPTLYLIRSLSLSLSLSLALSLPEKPVKEGVCPAGTNTDRFFCVDTCNNDGDCRHVDKCCQNGCRKECTPPQPPPPPAQPIATDLLRDLQALAKKSDPNNPCANKVTLRYDRSGRVVKKHNAELMDRSMRRIFCGIMIVTLKGDNNYNNDVVYHKQMIVSLDFIPNI